MPKLKKVKAVIAKVAKVIKVKEAVNTEPAGPTEDELELTLLKGLREELNLREIHDIGTLGVIIDRLQNKISSR